MVKPKKKESRDRNRVGFWLPKPWRVRLLNVLTGDGRDQAEFIRTWVIIGIERAERQKKTS